jgi:hypothetical protein
MQSQASAGIAWYNVPAAATAAPAATTLIVPPGTAVGQVISSADIRSSAAYAGGLIGFALIRDNKPVYYSGVQAQPAVHELHGPRTTEDGARLYHSKKAENTFYLAFEDCRGGREQLAGQRRRLQRSSLSHHRRGLPRRRHALRTPVNRDSCARRV